MESETESSELSSIQEVVRMSGVSSRTLRHYDEIGLLAPATIGDGGIRYYGRAELLCLQRILLMRELDLGLADIKKVLENRTSEVDALRQHKTQVAATRKRLARLEMTIDQTIESLEKDLAMTAAELFEGFDAELQQEYEKEVIEKYGAGAQDHVNESWRRIGKMTTADVAAITQGYVRINEQLLELMREGSAVDDDRVQTIVGQHYKIVCEFWTPNAEQYAGLGQLYCDDKRFRANYDVHDPDLVEYVRDAMACFAVELVNSDRPRVS